MPSPPADPAPTSQPAPAPGWEAESASGQRRSLVAASVAIIVMMFLAVSAFAWREHQLALDKAGSRANRNAQRLANDLEQTLTVARTVINQVDAQLQPAPEEQTLEPAVLRPPSYSALLSSLPLPFSLHAIGGQGRLIAIVGSLDTTPIGTQQHHHQDVDTDRLTADRWALSTLDKAPAGNIVPLTWTTGSNAKGISGYGVDLSLFALNDWLERDRIDADDRVSLFWMNTDGTATLMARAPAMAANLGKKEQAPWVEAANRAFAGVVDQVSPIDGLPRRVAFQRLNGAAGDMVVVYGVGTHMALSDWRANLPFFVGLALLLAAAMSYGTWRLDRSLRALAQSKRHFQLTLDSGNVWDWDIPTKTVRYSPLFLKALGWDPVPPERMASTLFKAVHPDDVDALKAALVGHVRDHQPYALTFRIRDGSGQYRWFDTKGQAFWDSDGKARYMAGTTFEITSKRKLEDAQRQTLKRLDTLANASPVLYWTANLSGEVDWVNHRWLEFTGRRTEDELGHGWLDGIHPDDRERRQEAMAAALLHQRPFAMEFRLRFHDGSHRWVLEQCRPLLDADHRPIGFIGSCLDLSELKQAEADARQRGAMLESMFNVLQDMLFEVDLQGRIISYHGSSDDNLYVAPEAFLGRTADEVLPPEVASLILRELGLIRTGQVREFEYALELPTGLRQFSARLALAPGSEHCMLVARDITERESLRSQRERLQQFMALQARLATRFINLPVVELDQSIGLALGEIGAFVQADRAYIFAYDLQARTASNTHEWCAEGVDPAIDQLQDLPMDLIPQWVEAHLRQEAFEVHDVQSLPDGPLRDILEPQGIRNLIALPMNAADQLLGFVGFDSVHTTHVYTGDEVALLKLFADMLVNVLGRQQTDARLHELTHQLEARVKERTRQLDTSVKRLSQANRELESFAYSVSHDLKSPVRSVEGFAALLLEDHGAGLSAEVRDYLQRIQRSAHHMARLINDLLAYARIEQMDTRLVAVPVAPTVKEVLDNLHNDIERHQARVQLQIPDGLAVRAHPQGLSLVLRNLIDNALKFTRPGVPPDITVTATDMGAKVHLTVKDQGQGFDMKYHDRIFAIFQRLHRPDEVNGTGIGLAMVHKAVERMDGRIWAQSQPGQGAAFHIELPRA